MSAGRSSSSEGVHHVIIDIIYGVRIRYMAWDIIHTGVGYTEWDTKSEIYRVGYTWSEFIRIETHYTRNGTHRKWDTHGVRYTRSGAYTEWDTQSGICMKCNTHGLGHIPIDENDESVSILK